MQRGNPVRFVRNIRTKNCEGNAVGGLLPPQSPTLIRSADTKFFSPPMLKTDMQTCADRVTNGFLRHLHARCLYHRRIHGDDGCSVRVVE